MYGDVSSIRQVRLGQDISARSGGETGEQRRPILRLVLAGLALVHDLVLIVVHDRPLVLLLIQLQLLVSIPSPQPKLSLILMYRNHWQNANRVSAHSESSHNPYTHACKRSHAALPVALFYTPFVPPLAPTSQCGAPTPSMLVRLASPPLLLVSALDPSNHSRPRRTVPADCALPTYPAFVHAAPIHTATFTRFLWDCPISLLRRKAHIRAYTPVTPRVASLSARRNDKRANIRTQMPLFASLCAHGRRFGAHLGTQTSGFVLVHWRFHA